MNGPFRGLTQKIIGFRLKTQLILVFVALFATILTIVSVVAYKLMESVVERQSAQASLQQFQQTEYNLDSFADEVDRVSRLLAIDPQIHQYIVQGWTEDFESVQLVNKVFDYFSRFSSSYKYIESIYCFTENGVVLGLTPKSHYIRNDEALENQFYSSAIYEEMSSDSSWRQHWYGGLTSTDFLTEVEATDEERRVAVPLITAARSVNSMGSPAAAVIINIKESEFSPIFSRGDGADGRVTYIVNEDNVIVSHHDPARIGQRADSLNGADLTPQHGSFHVKGDLQCSYYRMNSMGWTVVSEVPLAVLHRDINQMRDVFVVLFVCSLAVALFASIYWLYRLTKPLDSLRIAMQGMEHGELGGLLEEDSKNELGRLGRQFNRMSLSIQELVEKIKTVEAEKRSLEKEALQSQINPHFLYNTLSNVKYMAVVYKAEPIADCVTALGNLLRSLYKSTGETCPLSEELAYIDNYVKIMNYRFGGGILLHKDIPDSLLEHPVIRFILQPVLENCISHGFEYRGGSGNINISAREFTGENGSGICLIVQDDGAGMSPEALEKLRDKLARAVSFTGGDSIGLANVHRRIRLSCGDGFGVTIDSTPEKGAVVTLFLK